MLALVLFLCLSLVISTMSPRTAAGSAPPVAPEVPPKEEIAENEEKQPKEEIAEKEEKQPDFKGMQFVSICFCF